MGIHRRRSVLGKSCVRLSGPGRLRQQSFRANNVTFAFAADFSRDLTVRSRSISYNTLGSSPLLTESIPVFINSLVTHMWLPVEVCQRFEAAFNLTWNEEAQLYLLDNETHTRLSKLNPVLALTLGHASDDDDDASSTVKITLPYGAFDLTGSPPFVESSSKYLPLKRAEHADLYTLGRVFLQGAYIIADYERQTFTVSQALFPDASNTSGTSALTGIAPLGGFQKPKSLGAGTIAAFVVGPLVGVLLVTFGLMFWLRRRKATSDSIAQMEPYVEEKEHEPELAGQDVQVYDKMCKSMRSKTRV